MPVALISAALGLAYAATLAPGITWANNGDDSGDLIAATATLGIPHPTGYPTYMLLARLFQLLPIGDLALRSTLFSAVSAVLAALCLYLLTYRLLADGDRWASAIAQVVALAFGLSRIAWSQAVIAEVYSLNALFVALLLLFTLSATRGPTIALKDGFKNNHQGMKAPRIYGHDHRHYTVIVSFNLCILVSWWLKRLFKQLPRQLNLQGLAAGLALGNHVTIALPVAFWLMAVLMRAPAAERMRRLGQALLGIAAGLLVYLYLPLRAAAHPPINWGDPHNWEGFWWVISGHPYRGLAFGLPLSLLPERAAAWAGLLIQQFGWLGVGLGFFGLLYGAAQARLFAWLSAGIAVVYSVFALTYNTADSYAYLIPVYLVFAIWIGLGIDRALRAIKRYPMPALPPMLLVVVVVALAWHIPATARLVDASQNRQAIEYATMVLKSAPAHAIILTTSGKDTFPLWYEQFARGKRPDLMIVVDPLLDFTWYHEMLHASYPALKLPDRADINWMEAILAANGDPSRMCRTNPEADPQLECGMQSITTKGSSRAEATDRE